MKKATCKIEFYVEDEDDYFKAGECWMCPWRIEEELAMYCELGFKINDCKLEIEEVKDDITN